MTQFRVELHNIDGVPTALGTAGPYSLVVDRSVEGGGGGKGFNGGQLLHLAVAGCISNDLFREARTRKLTLKKVVITVDGDFSGSPAVSAGIDYTVEVEGDATDAELADLVKYVDEIAEIPNSLRRGTPVKITSSKVAGK